MLRPLDLTTALRPSLLPDETLLFVQDSVGLYGGKAKLADYQNGQAYLTSYRVCYIDNEHPRERAVAVDLKDVERCELFARFLKSSPKVTLIPKVAKFGPSNLRPSSTRVRPSAQVPDVEDARPKAEPDIPTLKDATWVCPICSFSNPVPSNFDTTNTNDNAPLPDCQACGIKPPITVIKKAVIKNLGAQQRAARQDLQVDGLAPGLLLDTDYDEDGVRCPRCTFQNHPSLKACEMCGTSLVVATKQVNRLSVSGTPSRSSSPAIGQTDGIPPLDASEEVKLSFRAGGDKIFHERLKHALTQRKWLSGTAPPVPRAEDTTAQPPTAANPQQARVGIAGLERRGIDMRKNNEMVIGNAFEDLAALMASAKEIIALAETLNNQSQTSDVATDDLSSEGSASTADPSLLLSQLNLTTTKDMLSASKSSSTSLYLTELCRSIAEFLTDDRHAVLKNAGGVMSLVDLWSVFNRARGGVELVSPADFAASADLFDKLSLPVRLRKFKSGLLVVQERHRTDEKTVAALLEWLRELKLSPSYEDASWDWHLWGRGVTAQETAEHFSWSIGVANEELEMAEEQGALCRESGIEGVRFWENHIGQAEPVDFEMLKDLKNQQQLEENLKQIGML